MARGGVGGVNGGVAEAVGLRHHFAARGASVERRGEARDVKAQVPLDDGDQGRRLDDGAVQRGVRQPFVVGAGPFLRVRHHTCALAVRGGAVKVGGVEGVHLVLGAQPRPRVKDTHQLALRAARSNVVGRVLEERGEALHVGQVEAAGQAGVEGRVDGAVDPPALVAVELGVA